MPVEHTESRNITRHPAIGGEIAQLAGRPLLANRGIPLNLEWVHEVRVNTSAVERRAQRKEHDPGNVDHVEHHRVA